MAMDACRVSGDQTAPTSLSQLMLAALSHSAIAGLPVIQSIFLATSLRRIVSRGCWLKVLRVANLLSDPRRLYLKIALSVTTSLYVMVDARSGRLRLVVPCLRKILIAKSIWRFF